MKRDKTGKFIQTWEEEPKQAVKLSLTKTAWQILQQRACEQNMSRSELVEHYARSWQSVSSVTSTVAESDRAVREFPLATQTQEPADVEIEARFAAQTAELHQANTRLQERVAKLEQELQQQTEVQASQRQWLEAILNFLPTPLILIDPEAKRVTFSNKAANKLAGSDLSSDRIAGVYNEDYHCTDETGQIIPPELLPSARAARGEKIHGVELNWHNPTGVYRLLVYADTLPAMHDRSATSLVVFQDISERKQMEVQLIESNRRITNILESITDAFIAVDHNWRITYANQEAARMNGKLPEELIGQDAWEEWAAVRGTKTEQEYRRAMVEGVPVHFEEYYAPFDLWVENHAYPSPDGLSVFFRDISDRKRAEAILQESEERYRSLAQLIPQLVWIANDRGVLLDVNQRWIEFTGLTLEQAKTEGWSAVVHPDDVPILNHHWIAAQQNAIRYQAEGRMRRADGVYRWYLHQALPLKNQQGQVVKWFGTATDIDDQKQLEQQRDREAAERHRILQQEQKAREEAERANRIKDEFLAVLSHELRSPLNPILGWSRLLQTRKFNEAKTTEALQIIERNAKLQAELIEDLLDVSRIIRGKLSLNIAPINLASTIRAALETVQLAAQAKSIQIQTHLEPNVGKVAGDSSRLQQVVWNLLSNAIKFTPQGGRVEVRLESYEFSGLSFEFEEKSLAQNSNFPTPNSQSFAKITVTDTGKGISPDFLPHVFDYFRQADSTTTRKFGGLGLGLAIVHHLVELHGGTVHADSPGEGQGATFTVRLPLMPTQPETNQDGRQLEPSLNLNGIKVLVVDDDADSREFVAFVLEEEGANVTMASSAREALAALSQFQPDILLSDIGMPEIDGYMLIQQVRALPPEQGGRIRAIALTPMRER